MSFSATRLTLYAIISALEGDLRAIAQKFLSDSTDSSTRLTPEVVGTASERMSKELGVRVSNPSLEELLPYVDLSDLYQSLNRNGSLLPKHISERVKELTPRLDILVPIRNRVAHSRPLHFDDLPTVLDLAEDLLKPRDTIFAELKATMARLEKEPSFVLGLSIPAFEQPGLRKHNLPDADFDETGFIGRRQQVSDIQKLLMGAYPVVTIVGDGGLGKTALALKVAYEVLDAPNCPFDTVVWTSSKSTQLTATEIVAIDGAIRDSLGVFSDVAEKLTGAATPSPMSEVLEYMSAFRILLILDNLETVLDDKIRTFLGKLPQGSKILITSRIGLGAYEYPVKLEPLERNEALQLLRAASRARGVSLLRKTDNKNLLSYCESLKCNPGFIKWFVAVIQSGRRPEDALADPKAFLNFCMSNVYSYLSLVSKTVLRGLLCCPGRRSQAELGFLCNLDVLDLQRALQQLLTTNMVNMATASAGTSTITLYEISELARAYVSSAHPISTEEGRQIRSNWQKLVATGERLVEAMGKDPYAKQTIRIRTQNDRIIARYLVDALAHSSRGELKAAEGLIDKARALAPEYFEVHRVSAFVKAVEGDTVAAQVAYEAAIELEPKSAPLRMWYAGFLMRYFDDVNGALVHLREGIQLDPQSPELQLEFARANLYLGNFQDSERITTALIASSELREWMKRKAWDLHLQRFARQAESALASKNHQEALKHFEEMKREYERCPLWVRDREIRNKLLKCLRSIAYLISALELPEQKELADKLYKWFADATRGLSSPPISKTPRARGTIKAVMQRGLFGFIASDSGGECFFNRSCLRDDGAWQVLEIGVRVEFTPGPNNPSKGKAPIANDIVPIQNKP